MAALARLIESTKGLMLRFVDGFDEASRTRQGADLPNHLIWTLGHCALTMNKLSRMFDGMPVTESDFIEGDGARGDAVRFDTQSVCFGSVPVDDGDRYPTLERGCEIYSAACERLAQAVRELVLNSVEETVLWHDAPIRVDDLISRIAFHNGAHSGQIMDLRRALGMPRVIH